MFKRIIITVLDSAGIGAMPDAGDYGDAGANTLGNMARSIGGLFLPVLSQMGLGTIVPIEGLPRVDKPISFYGKMTEQSLGKDTTSGHWEIAGCPVFTSFPVYPTGFPPEVIQAFCRLTGYQVLGNIVASGTEIIARLGEEHVATGRPIIYTSADSVFQIAAHEDVIPLKELYEMCRIAREQVCIGQHAVGRIIARPFTGSPGKFVRTANRHDYSLEPTGTTILDLMKEATYHVIGIGKIGDIFANRGLTQSLTTISNDHGMETLLKVLHDDFEGLIVANLVEFDSHFGHRRNTLGYARALERFDGQLALLLTALRPDDLLIVTADHGCDPTFTGTDHTREYVPLLVFYQNCKGGNLGVRSSFADIGQTVADNFNLSKLLYGQSFLSEIRR